MGRLPPWTMKSIGSVLSSSTNHWLLVGSILALLWGWLAASFLWPTLYMVILLLASSHCHFHYPAPTYSRLNTNLHWSSPALVGVESSPQTPRFPQLLFGI